MYDSALLIGRFQPFHKGHLHAVHYVLERTQFLRLGIGSSDKFGEPDNPFTVQERHTMIIDSLPAGTADRITIHHIPDLNHHIRWMDMIRDTLPPFDAIFTNDAVTARLYQERGIPVHPIPILERSLFSGTQIRHAIAASLPWEGMVPSPVVPTVRSATDRIRTLLAEAKSHV